MGHETWAAPHAQCYLIHQVIKLARKQSVLRWKWWDQTWADHDGATKWHEVPALAFSLQACAHASWVGTTGKLTAAAWQPHSKTTPKDAAGENLHCRQNFRRYTWLHSLLRKKWFDIQAQSCVWLGYQDLEGLVRKALSKKKLHPWALHGGRRELTSLYQTFFWATSNQLPIMTHRPMLLLSFPEGPCLFFLAAVNSLLSQIFQMFGIQLF